MQIRSLQLQGYDPTVSVTAGAVLNAVGPLTTAPFFLVALPLAWHSFHLQQAGHQGGHSKTLVLT